MTDTRKYSVNDSFALSGFSHSVEKFLQTTFKLDTQILNEGSHCMIQGREGASWKRLAGMDSAVSIKAELESCTLTVEIGNGKWLDKAAGAAIGWFLFWPALIPTALGAYKQSRIPGKTFEHIEQYLSQYRKDEVPMGIEMVRCVSCQSETPVGANFCTVCGNELMGDCSSCGSKMQVGDIFCRNCGAKKG